MIPWHLNFMHIPELWQHSRGLGVTIALLDTGVASLDALGSRVTRLDADGNADRGVKAPHGTMCASLLLSTAPGAPGVCPEATLVSYNTASDSGGVDAQAVVRALEHLSGSFAVRPVDLALCAFNLDDAVDGLDEALEHLHQDHGVEIIAPLGGLRSPSRRHFPDAFPFVRVVGGLREDGRPIAEQRPSPDASELAPAWSVPALRPDGRVFLARYTSVAAALVCGRRALELARARNHAQSG